MKLIDRVLDEKSDVSLAFFWQIIGPLFVLCTFALDPHNPVVFLVGAFGLFFCSKYQMKGFFASLILIGFVAIGDHIFVKDHHLWFLGLESSYAAAFFITAMNADRHQNFIQSLFSQIETKNSSITHLEDEFTKSRADVTKQQMFLSERIESLQKQMEEALSDQSSLLILNEVLRKTSSRHLADSEALRLEVFGLQSHLAFERMEKGVLEKQLAHLQNESKVVEENQVLCEELNQVRIDREQTHIINGTLAKLHAKENLKAESALDQIKMVNQEKEALEAQLEKIGSELSIAIEEKKKYALLQKSLEAMELDRISLKEQLKSVASELEQRPLAMPIVDLSQYVAKDTAVHLEERVQELSKLELLYKQLKAQFIEKNEVLHKTRSELFHKDNTCQALQIELEKSKLLANEAPHEVISELTSLETEISALSEENDELQNIITTLSNATAELSKRKKKVKLNPDQDSLDLFQSVKI